MDETGAYYTEWSKPERKTPIQYAAAAAKSLQSYPTLWDILMHIYGIEKDGNDDPICETAKETHMYRTVFWTLWEKVRVGWFERMALKHVYYHIWNRSTVQVRCMIQGAWGWCTGMIWGMGWGGRWEGGSEWGTHVHPWLIHVNVRQKPLQYCN